MYVGFNEQIYNVSASNKVFPMLAEIILLVGMNRESLKQLVIVSNVQGLDGLVLDLNEHGIAAKVVGFEEVYERAGAEKKKRKRDEDISEFYVTCEIGVATSALYFV
ncbi:hypothetical protein HDU98_009324 [Podochytrium sp. JEL0797]|nr:hypothetical protein HDU98_009324 [Podochytrium sp. JEL0797]